MRNAIPVFSVFSDGSGRPVGWAHRAQARPWPGPGPLRNYIEGASLAAIRRRSERELVVAVEEEWGYRSWIWFPGGTPAQLERAWEWTLHMPTGAPPNFLHGQWLEVDAQSDYDGFYDLFWELWRRHEGSLPPVYTACTDGDDPYTCLRSPDGRTIYHCGRDP